MSMILMVQAMQAKVGNPLRKLVLLKLADNANDKGECWPSYQHIADQCEIGRSTVKCHIKALADAGYLSIEARNDGKSSNRFKLTISEGKPAERMAKPRPATRSGADPVSIEPGQENSDTRSGADPVPGQELTPEPVTIEPIKEPVNTSVVEDDHQKDLDVVEWMIVRITEVAPKTKTPDKGRWAKQIRLMRERDNLTRREIAEVFNFANRDAFWKLNILSPLKLREKFPRLHAQMSEAKKISPAPSGAPPEKTKRQQLRTSLRDVANTDW